MSLDAVQVNKRIGLGQSSFGSKKIGSNTDTKTTGLSAQATKNLSGASIANKPSVFSFTQQSGYHRVYGTNAAKGRNQLNLERHRASLNAQNQGVRRSNADYSGGIMYTQGTTQHKSLSTADKIGIVANSVLQGFQLGAQLFGGVKNGAKIDQGMSSLGNGGSQVQMSSSAGQSAIAGMQSAQTSAELSSAIGSAQTQLAQMNTTAASGNFAAKANTAKTNMDTYKADVSKSQSEVKNAQQDVKTRQESVKASSDMRDNSLRAVQLADSKYGAAAAAHTQAKDCVNQANQNLQNAQTALASTPKTITDASGNQIENPEYKKMEEIVTKAENSLKNAKATEETTQKALDEADQARDKSNTQLNKAIDDLATAQDRLDTQKGIETTCKNSLIKTEADYKKSQETYQNAQDDMQKYLEFQQDTKQLQAEIAKQQERLTKLQEKEEKQINKLNKKIDKGIKKNIKSNEGIDPSNGMNIRERYLQNNIERRNDKNAARIAQRDAIAANHV